MNTVMNVVGAATLLWFAVGLLAFAFLVEVKMPPGPMHPPLGAKLWATLISVAVIPYLWMTKGSLPNKIIIAHPNVMETHQREFMEWQRQTCDCPSCRSGR
jgi:hypothetical protein